MPVPTLLNESDRNAVLTRIRQVRPDTPRKWGQMDAPRMLCHIADQMRVAVGELGSTPSFKFLSRSLLKWLVVNTGLQPPPGKVQTAPEMLTTSPKSWDADLAACEALVSRVG